VTRLGKKSTAKYDKVREKLLKTRAATQGLLLHRLGTTSGYITWYLVDRASKQTLGLDHVRKVGLDLDGIERKLAWHYASCPPLPFGDEAMAGSSRG